MAFHEGFVLKNCWKKKSSGYITGIRLKFQAEKLLMSKKFYEYCRNKSENSWNSSKTLMKFAEKEPGFFY